MRTTRNSLIASAIAATLTASLAVIPTAHAQDTALNAVLRSPAAVVLDSTGVVGDTERELRDVTSAHLKEMGHTPNQEAENIALAWVAEAALGQVDFISGAGKGSFGADRGEGQVYRFSHQSAQERINWLDRERAANPATTTYGFGTAVLDDTRGNVYLAEFFLGA